MHITYTHNKRFDSMKYKKGKNIHFYVGIEILLDRQKIGRDATHRGII